MYSFTIVTLLLTASYVVAVPVTYEYKHNPTENPTWKHDKRPADPNKTPEKEALKTPGRLGKVDGAVSLANDKIGSMKTFLDNHPDEAKLKDTPQWKSSFGPNASVSGVRTTVDRLHDGHIRINSADPEHADRAANRAHQGVNGFTRPKSDRMGSIHLGSHFYRGDSEAARHDRAGTIIHEATHQLSRTGDHARADTNKIIKGGFKIPADAKNSYRDSPHFNDLLQHSGNMQDNADSFRKFAEACHGAVRRRALLEDDPVGYYLAKRSSCALPANYFAKKAAANKAAAAKGQTAGTKSGLANAKSAGATSANAKGKLTGTKATTAKGKAGVTKVHKVGKGTPTKAAKGVHKVGKGTGARVAPKGLKSAKGAKVPVAKGLKGSKSAVGSKAGRKTTAGAKGLKSAKGTKATKGAKGPAARGTKGVKAAKGVKSAVGATKGKASKASAPKGAKSTSSKSKQSALSPKRGQGVTKSASKAATKAAPKAGKVANVVPKAAAAAKVAAKVAPKVAPKKKNSRRALMMESLLDELE